MGAAMAGHRRGWLLAVVVAAVLVVGGIYCWRLPWDVEAVVIGQVWTPHIALAMFVLGLTGLAGGAIAGVTFIYRRRRTRSWAFEIAALAMTGVAAVWVLIIAVTSLGLIPASASFTETRVNDEVVVTRTTVTPGVVTRTTGMRDGLLVRWGASRTASK